MAGIDNQQRFLTFNIDEIAARERGGINQNAAAPVRPQLQQVGQLVGMPIGDIIPPGQLPPNAVAPDMIDNRAPDMIDNRRPGIFTQLRNIPDVGNVENDLRTLFRDINTRMDVAAERIIDSASNLFSCTSSRTTDD